MEPGYINIAEIEFICDAGPLTMVVMKTSYFDQQRVERKRRRRKKKKSSKGAGMRRGCLLCTWLRFTPLSGRRNRERSILHLDLSRRGAKFVGVFFVPVSKGEGCSLTPTTSGGGSQGVGSGQRFPAEFSPRPGGKGMDKDTDQLFGNKAEIVEPGRS